MFLRRFKKSKSLRIVNLVGLTVIFISLLLSIGYIKKEQSYDRFHTQADRIFRYAIQVNGNPVDGRVYEFSKDHFSIANVPTIEDVVLFNKVDVGVLQYQGNQQIIRDIFIASSNFFDVFSFKLLQGNKETALNASGSVAISQSYANQIFGEESPIGKEIHISSNKIPPHQSYFISGVYEDFPETSHFRTDLIIHRPESENQCFSYVYLLLRDKQDVQHVKESIASNWKTNNPNKDETVSPYILPLTDIHLHSRVLRELDVNGNIHYMYLIGAANLLLLIIVLFNLWLNTRLIFSYNRKYYQLLRLNGASSYTVLKDELFTAILLAISSIVLGGMITFLAFPNVSIISVLHPNEIISLILVFLISVVGVSLIPALMHLSSTIFLNTEEDLRTSGFKLSNIRYMLIAQYAMVMFIVIVGLGISKQIELIKTSQVGGQEAAILVMKEQPEAVKERFDLLKAELLKHPEIQSVTTSMQLPGSAIRDHIAIQKEGQSEDEATWLPLLVVGNDFLPFFQIQPLAGKNFEPNRRDYQEEWNMLTNFMDQQIRTETTEEYLINQKAVTALGFESPQDAIGKVIHLHGTIVGYINKGTIVGVTDNFNYTTTFEDAAPQIILQRNVFQHCIMVRLSPDRMQESLDVFNRTWNQVYPNYQADYTFLNQVYDEIYQNELHAEKLTQLFALLCLIIANLGLIIIMAFIIRRKTKEIGIRKVNGATPANIIISLNKQIIGSICLAFLLVIPLAYWVMNKWLQNFAYQITLDGWLFAMGGLSVLFLSLLLISWQSWRAANLNPIQAIKTE